MDIETILIIDNDPMVLSGVSKLLEREGYQALTTSNGSEGIRLVKKQPVDLVILDGNLPDLAEIRRLKARKTIKNLPAIILRPPTDTEDMDPELIFKSVDYLDKPFKAEELMEMVKRISRQPV